MHRALYIPEILLEIFEHCYLDAVPPFTLHQVRFSKTRDLAALARTCKTFKELALDMIWDELDDLSPLVRCLPETSWAKVEDVYRFEKQLDQSDWVIILSYSSRVRALPRLYGPLGLASDSIKQLSRRPTSISSSSIFPNLRFVRLWEPDPTILSLMQHLANTGLTKLLFYPIEGFDSAISIFGERCSNVSDFDFSHWADADTISDVLCRWQNLTSVSCGYVSLNGKALSHLSHLRNLEYLAFRMQDAVFDRMQSSQSSHPQLIFSALRELYLNSLSLNLAWRFFHHFRSPGLHKLLISLLFHPPSSDLVSFLTTLPTVCTPEFLTVLTIDQSSYPWCLPEDRFEQPSPYFITFDHLHPLTIYANITRLHIRIGCGVNLTERQLLSLASSWPRLEDLCIGSRGGWTAESALTPDGLVQLLTRCRNLHSLEFPLDTRGYTEFPLESPWRGLSTQTLIFLHIHYSPIERESVGALGIFFSGASYPIFNLLHLWKKGFSPEEDLYCDLWKDVDTIARRLSEKWRLLGLFLGLRG